MLKECNNQVVVALPFDIGIVHVNDVRDDVRMTAQKQSSRKKKHWTWDWEFALGSGGLSYRCLNLVSHKRERNFIMVIS